MADKLTPQQATAVNNMGGKLLVSAAAGSGKTKVLVDRLMRYLQDPVSPANLDDFLIITFSKAAAAELRGKIAKKLSEAIAANPGNKHLLHQMQRLYLAKISTVHSFCSDLIKEYAYMLDIPADFRMIDDSEAEQLQAKAMDLVLNRAYESDDIDFFAFIDSQGVDRKDDNLSKIIMDVYEKAQCHLNPNKWLDSCVEATHVAGLSGAEETVCGKYLLNELQEYLDMQIQAYTVCADKAAKADYMEGPAKLLYKTADQLRFLRSSVTWDEVVSRKEIFYDTLRFDPKCEDLELITQIKTVRDLCKEELKNKLEAFSSTSRQVLDEIGRTEPAARGIVTAVKQFTQAYNSIKRGKRVLDYADLEQKALDLLVGTQRSGPTAVSAEVAARYREVMVDEYQDTNAVQDRIFSVLTDRKNNLFMVGDVKQSIYQFRLADPGIFLEKYLHFDPAETANAGSGRKVLLSRNFRSSGGVIAGINDVFRINMSRRVGGLDYGADEALVERDPPAIPLPDDEVELYVIDVQKDSYAEEAAFTADRISQMLANGTLVRDGDDLRPVRLDDIVILLRSPKTVGIEFQLALDQRGIPNVSSSSTALLKTEEVEVLRAFLQTINNPLLDIPLLSVLSSRVFGFTADELAEIRLADRNCTYYEALKLSPMQKAKDFLELLEELRTCARMDSLSVLVNKALTRTKLDSIFSATENGRIRVENIQSFCQLVSVFEGSGQGDLGRFLGYLDNMDKVGLRIEQEPSGSGAVRIYSIHKSKGLEYPVVFLCGLSKTFNTEDSRAPVVTDSELGLGLYCSDLDSRLMYGTIGQKAILEKMKLQRASEEIRLLYVAMTRAKDRLIMTYTDRYLHTRLKRMGYCLGVMPDAYMASKVHSEGEWVMLAALRRAEAGELFAAGIRPENVRPFDRKWLIRTVRVELEDADGEFAAAMDERPGKQAVDPEEAERIMRSLAYMYPHKQATVTPSKQTATQLKGRFKDMEAADGCAQKPDWHFRRPSFIETAPDPKSYGNAMHTIMQYIRYENCGDTVSVDAEVERLVSEGYISREYADIADKKSIAAFFTTEIGRRMASGCEVLREFKFSILADGQQLGIADCREQVLLQGVVDCALVDTDGLTIVDFKTDQITEETVSQRADMYRAQVATYAYAMQRIYQLPVKKSLLYFFRSNRFVEII